MKVRRKKSTMSPAERQRRLAELEADPDKVARAAVRELRRITGIKKFDVCIVYGSGWDAAVKKLGQKIFEIKATLLPGFLAPTVQGHAGKICGYKIRGQYVLVFRGRKHLYEFKVNETWMEACMHYVRVAAYAGCKTYLHTNAVGGINRFAKIGQAVIVRNHNKIIGVTPSALRGQKFLECAKPYNQKLRDLCQLIDPMLVEGIYAQVSGPEFETEEEAEYLRRNLIDIVGMSGIPECLLAKHLGMKFLMMSVVTDVAGTKVSHPEVLAVLKKCAPKHGAFIYTFVWRLPTLRRVRRRAKVKHAA